MGTAYFHNSYIYLNLCKKLGLTSHAVLRYTALKTMKTLKMGPELQQKIYTKDLITSAQFIFGQKPLKTIYFLKALFSEN